MDFNLTPSVLRHIGKMHHEAKRLVDGGVFKPELHEHEINVPMFGQGENASQFELENIEALYSYLGDRKIILYRYPNNPNPDDGTLDFSGKGKDFIEYVSHYVVRVTDYDALDDFAQRTVHKPTSLEKLNFNHTKNRALRFNSKDFFYHGHKIEFNNSRARDYLLVLVAQTKSEEREFDAEMVMDICGYPKNNQPAIKDLKDKINSTIMPKLMRKDENEGEDFYIDTSIENVVVVKNPISQHTA